MADAFDPAAHDAAGHPLLLPEIRQDAEGHWHAEAGPLTVSVLVGEGETGRLFRRRALKKPLDGVTPAHGVCWLVGELNGVRAYIEGGRLVLTTRDLRP